MTDPATVSIAAINPSDPIQTGRDVFQALVPTLTAIESRLTHEARADFYAMFIAAIVGRTAALFGHPWAIEMLAHFSDTLESPPTPKAPH